MINDGLADSSPSRPLSERRRLLSSAQRRKQQLVMQDGLRPIQRKRVANCGRIRIAGHVELRRRTDTGRAFFDHVLKCGSVWECPTCSAKIRAERAEEVRIVVEKHGCERTNMLTLTVAHGLGHDLKHVRRGVANCFRRLTRGEPWKRFRSRFGLSGNVRSLEVTHGHQNWWHPHVHALLLFDEQLTEDQRELARAWLSERWANAVENELGAEHRPDDVHGAVLSPCHHADYLAKFGLELTAPGRGKRAKLDHRTPFEIAWDYATEQRPEDAQLWREYCAAMFGARMLGWSDGLRDRSGLGKDRPDEELVNDRPAETELVGQISAQIWDFHLRDNARARAELLDAAERDGVLGVNVLLARLLALEGPPDVDWGFAAVGTGPEVC